MTSTPTPEPERQWVCHKPGWMGPCSPQSTHHNGFDWGCGWIYFPAPSTPGEGTGRPGGWVEGIGWVALFHDLPEGTRFLSHYRVVLPIVGTAHDAYDRRDRRLVIVTRWADGTTPAPPASAEQGTERPDTDTLRKIGAGTDGDGIRLLTRAERAFLARAADWIDAQPPVPPTPTPCPYIVTGGEGTSYCSLAERSAMHAAAPPSTPADPRPTDPTGSEA